METLLYTYTGQMNNPILNMILYTVENKMAELGEKVPFVKKFNGLLIECCQNLIHHTDKLTQEEGTAPQPPSVSIYKDDEGYRVTTRNTITASNADSLRHYIDFINQMDKEELRKYYQKVLTNGQISERGGGGLGLLNIVRRTRDGKLHYEFEPAADQHFFFHLSFQV